ncbi:translation initiation factor IF-2 N-terminal domain-containing protein [Corynebacterium macginleyi]|uniref:translation initiation factor IF-2 N-terminal domain-containing protein n=1 Tax=Corynebacterium macginleyi TaxID=38290 RepID=UPI00190AAA9D|nr:translation initiation factor IF-2 N-terminal domain-containing protein [Corynebacterium macginleyi]MBK4146365.1 Rne/Rng family ribonuclease [Corynebacterium macginleyi]MBM0262384.1 translation initiation factor IF-2 N-terminal domain-containing protein [Corynebacterium macginleyi]
MAAQNSQETTENLQAAAALAQRIDLSELKDKTRVYAMAKKLGLSSRRLVAQLKEMGLNKTAQSSITRAEAGDLFAALAGQAGAAEAVQSLAADENPADQKPESKAKTTKRPRRTRKATKKSAPAAKKEPTQPDTAETDNAPAENTAADVEEEKSLRYRVRKNVDNEISQIEEKVDASLVKSALPDVKQALDHLPDPEPTKAPARAADTDAAEAGTATGSAGDLTGTVDPAKLREVLAEAGEDLDDDYFAPRMVPQAETDEDSATYDFAPLFMPPVQQAATELNEATDIAAITETTDVTDPAEDAESDDPEPSDKAWRGASDKRRRGRRGTSRGRGGYDTPSGKAADKELEFIDEPKAIRGSTRIEAQKRRREELREKGRERQHIVSQAEFLARREAVERTMVVRDKQREDGAGIVTQVGVLEDDLLVEHFVTTDAQASLIGNIYLGRVQNVLPSMEAAFVDIGQGRNGVLYASEIDWRKTKLHGRSRKVENTLKSGDQIVVQVAKDSIGHKGARLTTRISLAGRYLVYVPGGRSAGISRKLPAPERKRLKEILGRVVPGDGGTIIRTAAENVPEEAIATDVQRLHNRWEDISAQAEKEKSSKGAKPVTLYEEPNMLIKVVRDLFNEDFHRLIVDGERSFNTVNAYVESMAPDLADRVERYQSNDHGGQDAFAAFRIDEQLHKALSRKVWLPSGGTLVIDRTEAMTVIDVNTGKFTGSGGNLEETVTRNNLEAAEEIVRQMRLRDLGGMIVVDFIDMVLPENQDLVLRRLKEALGRDRTRHQVSEVTSLGLVQMTRKRLGTGLVETFSTECEHCRGRGIIIHEYPVDELEDNHSSHRSHGSSKTHKKPNNDPQQHPAAVAMHEHEDADEHPEKKDQKGKKNHRARRSASQSRKYQKTNGPLYGSDDKQSPSLEELVANVVVYEEPADFEQEAPQKRTDSSSGNRDQRGRGEGKQKKRRRVQKRSAVSEIAAIAYAAAENAADNDEVQEFKTYVPDDREKLATEEKRTQRGKKRRRATRTSPASRRTQAQPNQGQWGAEEKQAVAPDVREKTYEEAVAEFEASPRRKRRTRGNSRSDKRPRPEDFAQPQRELSAGSTDRARGEGVAQQEAKQQKPGNKAGGRGRRRSVRTRTESRRATVQASHRAHAQEGGQSEKPDNASRTAVQRHESISGRKRNSAAQAGRRVKRRVVRTNPGDRDTSHNAGAFSATPVHGEKEAQNGAPAQAETKVIRRGKKRAVKKASTKAPGSSQANAKDVGRRRRVARRATS